MKLIPHLWLLSCCFPAYCHGDGDIRTVAFSGGLANGQAFVPGLQVFGEVAMNNAGDVAFAGAASSPGRDDVNGIWVDNGRDPLALYVQTGDEIVGAAAPSRYVNFSRPILNETGQVGFEVLLERQSLLRPISSGFAVGDIAGELQLQVEPRREDIGLGPNVFLTGATRYLLGDGGAVAFSAMLLGGDVSSANDATIWRSLPGEALQLAAREGTEGPAVVGRYDNIGDKALNSRGDVQFWADGDAGSGLLVLGADSELQVLVAEGDPIPGFDGGTRFGRVAGMGFNREGDAAFLGRLHGAGSTFEGSLGVWVRRHGEDPRLIAIDGEPAPGFENGTFSRFLDAPVINDRGNVAFRGAVETPNGTARALWSTGSDGRLSLVAIEGQQAPGTPEGVTFGSFRQFAFNNLGQVAFEGFLEGPGIDTRNRDGIWAQSPGGTLELIIRSGDLLDVNDDPAVLDLREVGAVNAVLGVPGVRPTGNADGLASSFNDRGQIAFTTGFRGSPGSGVFVSDKVAIPEPTTVTLTVLATLWGVVGRRGFR